MVTCSVSKLCDLTNGDEEVISDGEKSSCSEKIYCSAFYTPNLMLKLIWKIWLFKVAECTLLNIFCLH